MQSSGTATASSLGTTEDNDRAATRDYEDKITAVLSRIVRVGAVSQATIILGALIMGAALLFASHRNNLAIASLDQKLTARLLENRCQCDLRNVRTEASAGNVTIMPDRNSFGEMTRDVLRSQGAIDGNVWRTPEPTGSSDR